MGLVSLSERGWIKFDNDPDILDWVHYIQPTAAGIAKDPKQKALWLRHGDTWFVGVNSLPNDPAGSVAEWPQLKGAVVDFLIKLHGPIALDRAQISVIYPGYPAFDGTETEVAHRYRKNRCGAHVDGLRSEGLNRRRFIHEPHQYVLGLPTVGYNVQASPMVVWEGSHHIIRAAFKSVLDDIPVAQWNSIDLTKVYHEARRNCFDQCEQISILAKPGECYLLHRLALHGIAPWPEEVAPIDHGRMVVYFRPEGDGNLINWLNGSY